MRSFTLPYRQFRYSSDNSLSMFDDVKTILSDQYASDKKTCRQSVSKISSYDLIDTNRLPGEECPSRLDTHRITVRFSPSVRVLHYDHTLPTITCSHVQNCWGYDTCGSGSDDTSCSVSRHSSCAGSASEDEFAECNCTTNDRCLTKSTFEAVLKTSQLKTNDIHRSITSTEILRQNRRNLCEGVVFPTHIATCSENVPPEDSSDSDSDSFPKVQDITDGTEFVLKRSRSPMYSTGSSESFYNNAETLKPVQVMHCRYVRNRRAVVVNARINTQNCHGVDMSKPASSRSVIVRYTLDNWNTYEDTLPGVVIINSQVHTTYKIVIPINERASCIGASVKFAMCLQASPTLAFWDNNNGGNFEVTVPAPQTSNDP
ncbi:hypothetical protein SARC_11873 [Sphaeroforma arctica JP610]|uniref:CBM21 domain-containing protein n=1 Tax=Sphaeroforma arctica JP610 TaxID=667725 RepID=A0A0L0FFQ9_9EUKA|nr:hypothetical protein SARC_11873 [Sphaeroforma arctica JP610]KNC75607.1 hypothetical protein SARC_11873 [Sphaeroforma arctica JP610]|eukprot:XP_014149509.1 hypothetical protein SARC_11873 [Sphaeroforma arctica JP610]